MTFGGLFTSYSSPPLANTTFSIPLFESNITLLTVAFLPGVDPSPIVTTIFSGKLYPAPGFLMHISATPVNGSFIGVPPSNLNLSPTEYPLPPVLTTLLDNTVPELVVEFA